MKAVLGCILVLTGIFVGFYVGLWVMFIGGVVQIVHSVTADPIEAVGIGFGALRILFAGAVGAFSFLVLGSVGFALMRD